MKWPWTKVKTPEEELQEAQNTKEKEEQMLDHLNNLLEEKIDIARIRIEQNLVRAKLKNPDVEYKKRLEVEQNGKEESKSKEETKQDFNKKRRN